MNNYALIIFAKNPVYGKVKTRLAIDIGDEKALSVYEFLLDRIYQVTKNLEFEKYLFLSDEYDDKLFDSDFRQKIQKGKDLGEKMLNAFKLGFNKGFEKVIIIGSDIPELDSEIIKNAFDKLSEHDIVIGPSADGGYYLIGMKEPVNFLFENIEWSSERVLSSTIEKIKANDRSYSLLKELNDIDELSDLKNLNNHRLSKIINPKS